MGATGATDDLQVNADRSGRRRQLTGAVAGGLVVAGLAGAFSRRCLTVGGADRLLPAGPARDRLVRDGTRVTGTGRVVRTADGSVQLCAGAEDHIAALADEPGREPAPGRCARGTAMDLRGAYDLDALRDRRARGGAVEGAATVTGVYRGRTLTVERQEPAPVEPRDRGWYRQTRPPCAEPPGGWPRDPRLLVPPGAPNEGDVNLTAEQPVLDRYRAAHSEHVVDVALPRPFEDSAVLGVITPDHKARDAAEAALRPTYGTRLCVVVSRYTRAQVAGAERALRPSTAQAYALGVNVGGVRVGDDLQRHVEAEVIAVTPELQAVVDRFPAGLVRLVPALTPVV